MEKVIIAGGNGLVGKLLVSRLIEEGYDAAILTRGKTNLNFPKRYHWDPQKGEIDKDALTGTSYIINLAGENIASGRWSKKRKQSILESRTKSADLLYNEAKSSGLSLKAFISASATGYYGAINSSNKLIESDPPGKDFLATVCVEWEKSTKLFENLGARCVNIRTGIVLSKDGGALKKMLLPIKFGIGALPGNGKQSIEWIHIYDLCEIYIKAIKDSRISGPFNAVSPGGTDAKHFYAELAHSINRKILLPNIPAFIMYLIFGQMASILLKGPKISGEKITRFNFDYKYKGLREALGDLFID